MFTRVAKLIIDECSIKQPDHPCFMYHFKENGVSAKLLSKYFNGRTLVVYKYEATISQRIKMKCPWCGNIEKNIIDHARGKHSKEPEHLYAYKMQLELYSILLETVRNGHYLATAYTVDECQHCINPVVPGREGLCALPESSRDKVMSFKTIGFTCKGFENRWLKDSNFAFLIL